MWWIFLNFLINNSRYVILSFGFVYSHTNKVCILIRGLIGDDAIVCFVMKTDEMRGRINATEKRSSEPFNLFYWLLSNMTPLTINSLINKRSLMPRNWNTEELVFLLRTGLKYYFYCVIWTTWRKNTRCPRWPAKRTLFRVQKSTSRPRLYKNTK